MEKRRTKNIVEVIFQGNVVLKNIVYGQLDGETKKQNIVEVIFQGNVVLKNMVYGQLDGKTKIPKHCTIYISLCIM